MFDIEFLKNFLSNALATIVGVIIGIPIALWINKIQQSTVDDTERKKSIKELHKRKRKILELLLNELEQNNNLLKIFHFNKSTDTNLNIPDDLKEFNDIAGITVKESFLLRIEIWRALSDGGELQWIQDVDLLFSISTAYEAIRTVKELGREHNAYEKDLLLYFGWPNEQPQAGAVDADVLHQDLQLIIKRTIQLVDKSISTIRKEIESISI